ncbi:MAG: HEAT repeat domain-containing protein [Pirellulales bacterium]|nr:HEAT repeat domain-containing protein [Pirellulales bacterium]
MDKLSSPPRGAWWLAAPLTLLLAGALAGGTRSPGSGAQAPPSNDASAESPPTAEAPAAPPEIHVPDGFTVEMVAGPPLVSHPMMAGFDDRGRLYVADALGVNLNAEELQRDLPNRIQRLEDTDGDGRFDRATTFADKMTFPMGALWYRGAVYSASPPYIWRLEDTDDDGVADKREEIVGKFGFVGNAADIHGCFLGPEGRIYWCDGRHGHEFVDAEGKTLSKGQAARIFSCRPDGSDVQVYAGGGMDNPVEVAFTPEGEMLGTMTFYNPDEVRHDALVHYAYGGVYPRKHAVVEEFKRTGDFMPPLSLYDTVAPAGLTRYGHTAFGPEYQDNFFSVQFNTHKVLRHVLTREKSSFFAADEDFLTSPSIDFHPTDVLEDADGSLLVIDTGGWFRHGCPTSQIAKPEILGAIYRIRRAGAPVEDDPRGRHLAWRDATQEALAARLADRRPAVRERAIDALAQRGDQVVPLLASILKHAESPAVRQAALWSLARIQSNESRRVVQTALDDQDATVRLTAARVFSSHPDTRARTKLEELLKDESSAVAREAATALGRLGSSSSVPALLQAAPLAHAAGSTDRHFEHAVTYALIQIGARQQTRDGLAHTNHPQTQRAALIALDQMDDGQLTSAMVASLLDRSDTSLMRVALEIFERHPSWSGEVIQLAKQLVAHAEPSPEDTDLLRGVVLGFESNEELQRLVGDALFNEATPRPTRLALLDGLARGSLNAVPPRLRRGVGKSLQLEDAEVLATAIAAAHTLGGKDFEPELSALIANDNHSASLHRAAAIALAGDHRPLSARCFILLMWSLTGSFSPAERMAAAAAIGRSELTPAQFQEVLQMIDQGLGPLETPLLVRAFRGQSDPELGKRLLGCLNRLAIADTFSTEQVDEIFAAFPAEIRENARNLSTIRRDQSTADQKKRLEELASRLEGGNAKQGERIFHDNRAACVVCHRVQNEGGQIGPDLTKIGSIRAPRDLLESIVVPSASFARGYETYAIATSTGIPLTGVIAKETATTIVLRTTNREELRIPREDIEAIERSQISVMPDGLDRQLSNEELRDLIAYLSSLK